MEEESFTYATLRKIERAENTSPRLQKLEARFWERLGEHLTKLRQAFQDQQEDDPTSRRTVVLADELRNTQRLAESIWGFREKKIVQAGLAATRKRESTGEPPEHTTPEERHLYAAVCAVLQRSRDETAITDPFSRRRRPDGAKARPEEAPVPQGTAGPAPPTARHTSVEGERAPAAAPRPAAAPVAIAGANEADPGAPEREPADGQGEAPGPSGSERSGRRREEAQAPPLEGRGGAGASGGDEVALRLVQALADVPLFTGIDLVDYELAQGEIGNLPKNAAESLAHRGLVRMLASSAGPS